MDIEELLRDLFGATYKNSNDRYSYDVISSRHKDQIETIVRLWASRQNISDLNVKIAMLEAKIFAYEAIISNSNFNTILPTEGASKCFSENQNA